MTVGRERDKVKPNGKKRMNLRAVGHPRAPRPTACRASADGLPQRPKACVCQPPRPVGCPVGTQPQTSQIMIYLDTCDKDHASHAEYRSPGRSPVRHACQRVLSSAGTLVQRHAPAAAGAPIAQVTDQPLCRPHAGMAGAAPAPP